jgi:hypothetical protein
VIDAFPAVLRVSFPEERLRGVLVEQAALFFARVTASEIPHQIVDEKSSGNGLLKEVLRPQIRDDRSADP